MRQATASVHAGLAPAVPGQPVLSPLALATSFHAHPDEVNFSATALNAAAPHFYGRWGNPSAEAPEERLAELDAGEAAVVFASGMVAVSALFLTTLKAGDHLVLSDVCYAGVAELAHHTLPRLGVEVTAVDTSQVEEVAAALRPNTRLVHVETPANPILRLADIAAIAGKAHERGVELSVDGTMATPIATQPIALGADYVVHSLTKYACGHGDALGGAVIGRREAMANLRKEALIHLGGALNPFAAWLILRGLETLPLRMAAHQSGAAAVAAFLEKSPRIRRVFWPGLPSHPQHALARRQMRNFSGIIAFSASEGPELARRLADQLELVAYAVSLGKTRSLVFYIPTDDIIGPSFHLAGPAAERYRAWAGDGVFRLSVGIEDPADLIEDLAQALA